MGVPEKCQRDRRHDQRLNRIAESHHVFIFIDRRSMHKLDVGQLPDLNRAMGQGPQPVQILPGELIAGPKRGQPGDGIEVLRSMRPLAALS